MSLAITIRKNSAASITSARRRNACTAIWYHDHKGTMLLNERKLPLKN